MNYNNLYSNDVLQQTIDTMLSNIKAELTMLRNEFKNLDGGTLYIKKSKSYTIFTEYYNCHEQSIGKDRERIHMLARRKYVSAMIKTLESNYNLLKKLSKDIKYNSKHNISSMLNEYTSFGLDMSNIILSPNQQQWLNQPYERNPAYPEQLKFTTNNGNLMRTKSELIIANRLEHYHIPYLPEMPLWLAHKIYPKYPDFTILKQNGETIIWEHMGRMDKEDYFIKNSMKIVEYRHNGYSLNTNLIITFEEDISEPGMIDHIIHTRILS